MGGFTNCTTLGVEEPVRSGTSLQAVWNPGRGVILYGLPDGQHTVRVMDLQGRLVLETDVRSTGGRSGTVDLHRQGAALYMVVVDHYQAVKLAAIR